MPRLCNLSLNFLNCIDAGLRRRAAPGCFAGPHENEAAFPAGSPLPASLLLAKPPQNFKVLLYTSPDRYHNQAPPTVVAAFE